jgi:hypothetical protein
MHTISLRASLVGENFWVNSCSTFRCYLTKIIQLWTNQAQKIRFDIYRQTVQLVIFLPTFNTSYMRPKI